MDALETIGARIRRLRKEAGLSQEELSTLTYVSRETVRDWEKDAYRLKSDALVALAQCFRVSVDFILGIDTVNIRLDRLTEDEAKAVTMLVQASKTALTDLKISPSVKEIGDNAFNYCPFLNHVELSEGLLTIGDNAFSKCEELTAISIPASVTMIGNDVFSGCAETFVVTVEAGSYGEVWARTCGYAYVVNGQTEDTSWLD